MQPMLILSAETSGLAYLNGRLLGELGGEDVLSVPVSPRGAVYLEFHPMRRGFLPLCGRLTFAGGRVLAESVGEGMSALLWPSGASEIELTPEPLVAPQTAAEAECPDGAFRWLEPLGDTVGHALLHAFSSADAKNPRESEVVWENGAPRWPQTPESTALAAAEALGLGLIDEARGYMTPAALARDCLSMLMGFDGCLKMNYCAKDQGAIGMIRLLTPRCARVVPADYRAVPMPGPQGAWRLDDIFVDKSRDY